MNERIKEVAKQAGLKIESFMANPPKPFQILGSTEQFEKFAELIIEECIAQCWSVSELEHNGYVVSECSKRVRKHFGVE